MVGFPSFGEGVAFLIQLTSDPSPDCFIGLRYFPNSQSTHNLPQYDIFCPPGDDEFRHICFVDCMKRREAGGQIEVGVIICSLWLVRNNIYGSVEKLSQLTIIGIGAGTIQYNTTHMIELNRRNWLDWQNHWLP